MSTEDQVLILIVEVELAIGNMLVDLLEDHGYAAIHARSGDEALTHLATVLPALITLDMDMPGIGGEELLRLVRQRPETQSIPVLIVSAKLVIDEATRQLAQGVISKPFSIQDFLSEVQNFTSK